MPIESTYPPIVVPPVDLWTLVFERNDREFPEDHVLYVELATKRRFTFRAIHQAAEAFGRGLLEQWKWQKGDKLAVMTPNSADVAPLTFGTWFAGGVVCPVNYLYTTGELVSLLRTSQAKALVTNLACLKVACEAASIVGLPLDKILLVGDHDPERRFQHFSGLQGQSKSIKRVANKPSDLCFLVFSSGTTGLPKAVMLTHENLVANILQSNALNPGLATLVLLPLFDGTSVYVMKEFSVDAFCDAVQQEKITYASIVPPVAVALAKSPVVSKYDLSSLRMLQSAAAPAGNDLIEAIYKRLKVPVKQAYGLTEASPLVSTQRWEDWNKPIGCSGRLVSSMSMKIMSVSEGREVDQGSQGEIWIRGPNVTKGYYNNPKATAESIDAEGWYRTGDIGYVDEENNIYITDRLKELIKYNGFQVAPAELEGLLLAHPAVSDAAVIGVYSEQRATELPRAVVVLAAGYRGDEKMEKDLKDWIHQRVAPHKRLRGGVRFVQAIPKSNAGKLLRRVLVEQAGKEVEKVPAARL
ncbi:4-coumarate-CoA ligase 1 [Diaporthe helianthi]|uniref:4-coumarate-CoA ligase 1 n=1 Tax=Diaporthe helianthi TaxID=158607 RepID=A0A2P5I541_DIAHE|nr:4-coumarate-CoA ligase 1 [Diaporthe helianthi]